jgi:hypothetical protein
VSEHIDYVVKHYVRVSNTSAALKWVPCGPDCTHERQPDVEGGELTAFTLTGDQIEWVGDTADTEAKS